MRYFKSKTKTYTRGFTLIELLIVIVIIGILAGVLISVINPTAQQNRAKDANVKATLNKIALAAQSYVSAYGSAPDEVQFMGSIQNATAYGTECDTPGQYYCVFSIAGNDLPVGGTDGCNGSLWMGNGAGQCYFLYNGIANSGDFSLYAKSFGIEDTIFGYNNYGANAGVIQHCEATAWWNCVTP